MDWVKNQLRKSVRYASHIATCTKSMLKVMKSTNKKMIFYHPEHDKAYEAILSHVGNPLMQKIRQTEQFGIFMVEITSMLLNEKRFMIAMLANDNRPIGSIDYLSNLKWTSFQMRTLSEPQPLQIAPHNYIVQRGLSSTIPLWCVSRNTQMSTYQSDTLPIVVSLLHTRNNEYEYPNEGNLASAIETFQTIIQFS